MEFAELRRFRQAMEMIELMMLRQAAELYTCAEILRDAIDGDENDQFSAEYIDGERDMVRYAAKELKTKIEELLECFEIRENEPHECYFKWSLADNGWADHTCSECGFVENTDIHVGLGWNYCPNCGRKVISK